MENRSYCGLNCAECDALKATVNNDNNLREQTAKTWSSMYGVDIKPEQINCTGCKSDGVRVFHCSNCKIRACNVEKKYDNCSACNEYPCADESYVINHSKDAKDFIESKR